LNGVEKFPSVIADIMNRSVTTVDVGMKVIDAAKIMARERAGCVIAVEGGKAVGIVTERDMLETSGREGPLKDDDRRDHVKPTYSSG